MATFNPLLTLMNGVPQRLATRGTDGAGDLELSKLRCASFNIQIISVGGVPLTGAGGAASTAVVYLAFPPSQGAGSAVDSTHYNVKLDGTDNTSYTHGLGADDDNGIDLSYYYVVSDTDTVVVAIAPRQV